MKRKLFLSLALLASCISFSGCNNNDVPAPTPVDPECEHTDENHDHICDLCNKVVSECNDNDHDHKCDICEKVLSECSDENHDHKCDLCDKVISVHEDNDIDGKCDICSAEWSKANKELILAQVGELIPFFEVDQGFTEKSYYIEATISKNAASDLTELFRKTNKYTIEAGEYIGVPCIYISKVSDTQTDKIVTILIIENNGTTYVDVFLDNVIVSDFPIEKVRSSLEGFTEENIPTPTDGTQFIFEEGETDGYCIVTLNGNPTTFLNVLVASGYYVDESMVDYYPLYETYRCISSGRTLAIQLTISSTEYSIEYMGVEAPKETEWSEKTKECLLTLFDEIVSFPNAGFTLVNEEEVKEQIEDYNYFQVESYNIDAFPYAVAAFSSDESFTKEYEEDGNFYTFSKMSGYYEEKIVVSCLWSITTISFMKVFPTYTEWPAEQIEYCIDFEHEDVIPAATGESFYLYYEKAHPNIANVTVYGDGEDYAAYLDLLKLKGYTVTLEADGWHKALGSNLDICIYLYDATEVTEEGDVAYYKVEIQAFKPEKTYDYFPMEAVLEELDDEIVFDCPIPTGETFRPEYPYGKVGASDIKIHITGGDRAAYLEAIQNAGYEHYEAWDWTGYKTYVNWDRHLAIYVYDSDDNTAYAVEYGAAFNL